MDKAILLANDEHIFSKFLSFFDKSEISIEYESDIELIPKKLSENEYKIVIILSSFKISEIINLLKYISHNTAVVTIIFCKENSEKHLEELTRGYGTHLITLPTSKSIIEKTVKYAILENARLKVLNEQKSNLQNKIEELKMLDRAKCALIEYLKMTEKEAHEFIEKQAMNRRKAKIEIIEDILKTYEN